MYSLLLPLLALLSSVLAQTQAEIQACSNSIQMTSYPAGGEYTYSTTDTEFFSATYSYNPAVCTAAIRVTRLGLTDLVAGQIYNCQLNQFTGTGTLSSICNLPASSMTRGRMAILSARDGSLDWAFTINIGQRPTLVSVENQFGVIGEGPIPTGDEMRKRSWRQALLSDFNCPAGQSMCPVGFKGRFQCVNVASNVEACGSCPGALKVNDCTAIEGVDGVECRAGACHVTSCAPGWSVSSKNTECVPDFLQASRSVKW